MSPSFQITIGMLPARVPLAILDVRGEIDAQTGPQLEAAAIYRAYRSWAAPACAP